MNPTALAFSTLLLSAPAFACGGFFCDAQPDVQPIVQSAERVLFRVNPDDTITSVVEIQFQGDPIEFGWVLPLPDVIDVDAVTTAPAGLFDDLERLTAPRFIRPQRAAEQSDASYAAGMSSGCAWPFGAQPSWSGDVGGFDPWAGVTVVGEAVAGPFSIEIITADNAGNLGNWLIGNGYQVPLAANDAIAHYVASGGAFLGLKLQPDVEQGPLEALQFTFPGTEPMLPLMLTAVAAVENMEITTYVLGERRYTTQGWTEIPFDYDTLAWLDAETTDYESKLPAALDAAGGQAFVTEFAWPTERIVESADASADLLGSAAYVTRVRTFASPAEMTIDPSWVEDGKLGDVGNTHVVGDEAPSIAGWGLLAGLLFLVTTRREER